ncbi:MAG: ATP-binding protein, partial [Anaerolineae bacterium]|nr:ATP-binding protein [Anaerolineae bacterium]
MTCSSCSNDQVPGLALKHDALAQWIEREWVPRYPDQAMLTLSVMQACVHQQVLARFDKTKTLAGDYTFAGHESLTCEIAPPVSFYSFNGDLTLHTGAYVYRFARIDSDEVIEALVVASFWNDEADVICLANIPADFLLTWAAFTNMCDNLSGMLNPAPRVRIIGGNDSSFEPKVGWDEIILPDDLKDDLLDDVESFFERGIDIYKKLNLKPFRKLLLAGIPGTGKTMLCMALAQWALDRQYLVIYISSNDYSGAAFWKIERAVKIAAASELPTLILLEELDAYLKDDEDKALVLNVLDGAEAKENAQGTMLIATTNYPEAIDERVLKRPGRLDRVFIVPEVRDRDTAEDMLRHYLGEHFRETHVALADELVGYP